MNKQSKKLLTVILCAVIVCISACSTTTHRLGPSQAAMNHYEIGKGDAVLIRYVNEGDSRSSSRSELVQITNISDIGITGVGESGKASWKDMEVSIIRHVELGLKLGSPGIRIFAGNPHGQLSFTDYIKYSAEVLVSVLDKTDAGINIVIQNHQGSYNTMECIELIKMVSNPRFGLVFSPDHSFIMSEDMMPIYSAVKPYTRQLYVSDVTPSDKENNEKDFITVLPGKGVVPIKKA